MDEFSMEFPDLGNLKKIKIGHDNAGLGGAWYLEKVEVINSANQKRWNFSHYRWIGKKDDDGRLEHEIYADEADDGGGGGGGGDKKNSGAPKGDHDGKKNSKKDLKYFE
ncbi:hypothetical protein HELRODRAFT_164577 [Helobdella robusta]|uniref:PLAT domain-containing protein n=1 Tax=Helobdella robusta TaxID=6412 RepID=T1EVL4_HELRO|nr:hypothetical protein HELRODRAFT_164577 [Helobdella robusta]ESN94693.1 hypothetical protein HELRODRAFT_164577 [Helobdella robusta]